MTDTTTETRALIARVRADIAPADQPQALRDLARTADGEPRVDAGVLLREAEIIEIRQCIERADRHGLTNRFGDDRTLLAALDQERAENDKLRVRVAELEAERDMAREAYATLWVLMDQVAQEERHMTDGEADWFYTGQPKAIWDALSPLDDDARGDAQGDDNGR